MAIKIKVKTQSEERDDNIIRLPLLALRGLVIFPNNMIHFEVGRDISINAINKAMENGASIFVVSQNNSSVDKPQQKDIYNIGVVAEIKQVLRVSDDLVKILIEGKFRAKLSSLDTSGDYYVADILPMPLKRKRGASDAEQEALMRSLKDAFNSYADISKIPRDVVYKVNSAVDALFLSEFIASNIMLAHEAKQDILEQPTLEARLSKIIELVNKETRVLALEKEIKDKVTEQMDKNQRDYMLREQMRVISSELDEGDEGRSEVEQYRFQIFNLHLEAEVNEKLLKEVDRLEKMHGSSQEAGVIRGYLDACLELPWKKYTSDTIDIKKARALLDKEHYGLDEVKKRIIEILAVRKLAPDLKSQIICLVGPPGVGKTSIATSIAGCIGRKFARISLGGVRDEAEIRGHRRTYVGAMPGRIINAVTTAKSSNPVILLDEVDKLANDFRGDPASALLEALDPEQNSSFKDHFIDLPFDLSRVLFITTANSTDTIPRPLLDRMDIIHLSSYTRIEKFNIAKRHLIQKQLSNTGLKARVKFSDAAIYAIIDFYTREAGVRTLERTLLKVMRRCAVRIAEGYEKNIIIKTDMLEDMLGPKRFKDNKGKPQGEYGMANGLAWTSVGGEMLPIEARIIPNGSGKLELTGSLGDVMKESAKIAITFCRANCDRYGIDPDIFKTCDIHIHAPEGAVPKDGPSAGVTLTTALISALTKKPVRSNIAMTGEITLLGNVLAIGGLKEKSMAAYAEGIDTVLIPADNYSDLYEIDAEVKAKINFIPITKLEQLLEFALLNEEEAAPKAKKQTDLVIQAAHTTKKPSKIVPPIM